MYVFSDEEVAVLAQKNKTFSLSFSAWEGADHPFATCVCLAMPKREEGSLGQPLVPLHSEPVSADA